MKEKHYYIYYEVNLKKLVFTVLVCDSKKKNIYKVIFARNKIVEKCMDKNFPYYLSNIDQYEIYFHQQKMTIEDQCNIHKIFPYIPQFTNLQSFYFWYSRLNSKFSYRKYVIAKILANRILRSSYPADGNWNCTNGKRSNYLYCKWKDDMDICHIVLMDDEFFVSDVDYSEICQQEMEFVFSFDVLNIQPFIKRKPYAMLDIYLNGEGKKIFSFLTAKIMNHPMELLGKAGLSKLADNLNRYQDIHMDGKTLSDIFDVPLGVLKSVNKGEDLMLCTAEDRILLAKAFQENRAVFSEPMTVIGELWIRYYFLNDQTNYEIRNGGSLVDTVRYLNKCCKNRNEAYTIFGLYQNYLAYAQKIGENYIQGLYPKNLLSAVEESVSILQMRYAEEKILEFKKIVQSTEYQFLVDDLPHCRYRIRVPETQKDIYMAGKKLHNCLRNYVLKIKERETMVAFIEDKKKENKLVGAIEVHSGKMIQALGYCNEKLSEDIMEYLKAYKKRKQIVS